MALPLWCRVLQQTGRAVNWVAQAERIVRTEALLAFLAERHRNELTVHTYSQLHAYLPGGQIYEMGLAPWESALLEHPVLPRRGRVLLGAAGGGRELRALAERGYEVYAFEPSDVLREGAERVASEFAGSRCVSGAYADLARAVRGLGPLAAAPAPFDLVYFGWGSFTHVLGHLERAAVLAAARTMAPTAPLVLSFWVRWPAFGSRTERARSLVRRMFTRVGGAAPPPGLDFDDRAGFGHCFERRELETLAQGAGYAVELFDESGFPHAILVPTSSSAAGSEGGTAIPVSANDRSTLSVSS